MKGIVKGNVIIFDPSAGLADGTEVEIIPVNTTDPFCGIWQDDRTAEEIIKDIKASRFSRERDVLL